MKRLLTLIVVSVVSTSCLAQQHPGAEELAARAASEYELDTQQVLDLLSQAEFKQSIVDAISRPAESKPWYDYRPIFITQKRIDGGIEFWRENRELIDQAAETFGVDPQVIVAIIGVETFYGRITGGYRVLDALTTLSFYYPDTGNDRSGFFSGELMQFFLLGEEEGLPLTEVKGSYAGAMGLGQFIPSSYRAYAVDMDGDGRRDLWSSLADVIGSVANYLHVHGWEAGEDIVHPAVLSATADVGSIPRRDFKPRISAGELAEQGFASSLEVDPEKPAAVVRLEEREGDAFWISFKNFYVITRYNRSPLYAMAVYELSEALRKGMQP